MRREYLICYDICEPKRLSKVRKYLYSLALGGQKSALHIPLDRAEMQIVIEKINLLTKPEDHVHIIPVHPNPVCFGKSDFLKFEEGAIIL